MLKEKVKRAGGRLMLGLKIANSIITDSMQMRWGEKGTLPPRMCEGKVKKQLRQLSRSLL